MDIQIAKEQAFVATVGQLCDAATGVVIIGTEDLSEATDLVKLIKTRYKEIEGERVQMVKPFNDGVKHINERFKKMLEPLESAESEIKKKMLTFQQEEARIAEAARKEAERKAAEEAERLAKEAAERSPAEPVVTEVVASVVPFVPPPPKTTYGQYGAVSSMRKIWAYEVTDIAALAASRPDLVTVDAGRINAEIRGKGGEIPGLRIFEKETIAIR